LTQEKRSTPTVLRGKSGNRRRVFDRRGRPTPMFSRFTLRGRRTRIRRDTDLLRGRYIDRSTGRHLLLILILMLCITLDAMSTLYILDNGGNEVNPIMESALQRGVGWFLMIKLVPLPIAFLLLSIHRYFTWVRWALVALVLIYGSLAMYHLVLLARLP
jgi:hypothetical protein